jgi:hypothetical protein
LTPLDSPEVDAHSPGMLARAAILLITGLAGLPAAGDALSHFERIRSADPKIIDLLALGYRRSASFQQLADALEHSDLVVYVDFRRDGGVTSLHRVVAAGGRRYVWISIVRDRGPEGVIARLAHELQHATEVANAPDVVDDLTLAAFYRRGRNVSVGAAGARQTYETEAAQRVETAVFRELLRRR